MADITETNKEVILTESAVKQLITNIKDADAAIKGTESDSKNDLTLHGLKKYITDEATDKINNLNVSAIGQSNGQTYITQISQSNGKIQATAKDINNTFDATSNMAVSGKAIADALSKFNATTESGKFISGIKYQNGNINITKGEFSPGISYSTTDRQLTISVAGETTTETLPAASTSVSGLVKLSNTIDDSEDVAITPNAVKQVKDLADDKPFMRVIDNVVLLRDNWVTEYYYYDKSKSKWISSNSTDSAVSLETIDGIDYYCTYYTYSYAGGNALTGDEINTTFDSLNNKTYKIYWQKIKQIEPIPSINSDLFIPTNPVLLDLSPDKEDIKYCLDTNYYQILEKDFRENLDNNDPYFATYINSDSIIVVSPSGNDQKIWEDASIRCIGQDEETGYLKFKASYSPTNDTAARITVFNILSQL